MAAELLEIPKFIPKTSSLGDVCPVCRGSGWEIYQPAPETLERVYGSREIVNDYARKCTKCSGVSKYEEDLTGVPEIYREADISKFSFDIYKVSGEQKKKMTELANKAVYEFKKFRSQGFGLYIYSNTTGSGKTFLACSIGKSIMVKYGLRFKFITAIEYIKACQQGIENRKNDIAIDPSAVYRKCDLLVLDDIGAQKDTEFNREKIINLVNARMTNGLVTIYTSNLSLKDLNVDDRTKSRINSTTIPFPMPEESIRQMKSTDRQTEFLKAVFKNEDDKR